MQTGGSWNKGKLTRVAYRASEWARAADVRARRRRNTRVRLAVDARGVPLPPERLVVLVAGSPDLRWFLEGGRLAAEGIRAAADRQTAGFERLSDVLDFGSGCGRVLRHFTGGPGPRLHGCDYNPDLIDWCRRHLDDGTYMVNDNDPPLAWEAERFDLVWALSVFTHLPEARQQRWLTELWRVLRPGGLLIASLQGSYYLPQLTEPERRRFERGELIVRYQEASGTNLCTAFHPESYVRGSDSPLSSICWNSFPRARPATRIRTCWCCANQVVLPITLESRLCYSPHAFIGANSIRALPGAGVSAYGRASIVSERASQLHLDSVVVDAHSDVFCDVVRRRLVGETNVLRGCTCRPGGRVASMSS